MPPVVIEDASDMLLAITRQAVCDVPGKRSAAAVEGQRQQDYQHSIGRAARGEDGPAQLYVPAAARRPFMLGKRKIKLRPEELQKVAENAAVR